MKKIFSMIAILMMALTAQAATITVTWNYEDANNFSSSFTKDGVTLNAPRMANYGRGMFIPYEATFTTTLGNFTKIEISGEIIDVSGTGWSGTDSKMTWEGAASNSVSFKSGGIRSDGENLTFTFTIEATTVAVTSVSLSQTTATMNIGETVTLAATVAPDDATDKSVTWASSDESVATVADGVVTAVAAGTATITVTTTDGAKTATCTVTVAEPTYSVTVKEGTEDAANWTITPTSAKAGETVTIKYNGTKKVKSVKAVKKAASTPLDNATTAWSAGTFAVPTGGLTYSDAITVSGDVTLVLTDGETLTLNKGISIADGATLTVQGNGTMNVNGTSGSTASTVAGNGTLVLTSGTLNAKGGNGGSYADREATSGNKQAGGVAINGAVTVSGGTLTATGGAGGSIGGSNANVTAGAGGAAISGSVTLVSGTLTATGGNGGNGGDHSTGTAGAGGAAIGGDLTVNGGTPTTTNGSNGSEIGITAVTVGAGGKAVAGTVTDNR